MGAKKSTTSAPVTTTSQADNRNVFGQDSAQVGAYGSFSRESGNDSGNNSGNTNRTSFDVIDSSTRSSSVDNRDLSTRSSSVDNRSTVDSRNQSTVNYTGTDGGAVKIAQFNAALLEAVSSNQGDTVKTLAQMGARGITDQARAATDLFATSSTEAGKAWGHTIDKSSELIDRLLTTAQGTITGAQTVARDAISSYQPTENKTAGTMQYSLLAAAAIAALYIMKKA